MKIIIPSQVTSFVWFQLLYYVSRLFFRFVVWVFCFWCHRKMCLSQLPSWNTLCHKEPIINAEMVSVFSWTSWSLWRALKAKNCPVFLFEGLCFDLRELSGTKEDYFCEHPTPFPSSVIFSSWCLLPNAQSQAENPSFCKPELMCWRSSTPKVMSDAVLLFPWCQQVTLRNLVFSMSSLSQELGTTAWGDKKQI